jgi:hypothetical protein
LNKKGDFPAGKSAFYIFLAILFSFPALVVFGGRTELILYLFSCLVAYHFCVRKIRLYHMGIFAGVVILIAFVVGEVRTYSETRLSNIKVYDAVDITTNQSFQDYVGYTVAQVSRYNHSLLLVETTESFGDLCLGETIASGFQGLLPERLTGRHLQTSGQVLFQRMYGMKTDLLGVAGHEQMMGLVGESYVNFWIFGVVLTFYLLGKTASRLDAFFRAIGANPFAAYLWGYILFYLMTIIMGNVSTLPSVLIYKLSPLMLVYTLHVKLTSSGIRHMNE